jgi:hypothetical protein
MNTEPTVEEAGSEIKKMFPEVERANYDLLKRRLELDLPERWTKYFSGTLSEAMTAVRQWHKKNKQ